MLFFKADPFVFLQYRRAGLTDEPVAFPDGSRDVTDFKPPRFPLTHFTTNGIESLSKKCTDEIRLKLAGLGLFHLFLNGIELVQTHVLWDQGIAFHDFFKMIRIQCAFKDLIHSGHDSGVFTITDGVDEQVF